MRNGNERRRIRSRARRVRGSGRRPVLVAVPEGGQRPDGRSPLQHGLVHLQGGGTGRGGVGQAHVGGPAGEPDQQSPRCPRGHHDAPRGADHPEHGLLDPPSAGGRLRAGHHEGRVDRLLRGVPDRRPQARAGPVGAVFGLEGRRLRQLRRAGRNRPRELPDDPERHRRRGRRRRDHQAPRHQAVRDLRAAGRHRLRVPGSEVLHGGHEMRFAPDPHQAAVLQKLRDRGERRDQARGRTGRFRPDRGRRGPGAPPDHLRQLDRVRQQQPRLRGGRPQGRGAGAEEGR